MIKKILNFVNIHNLIKKNSKILLALSGGPDSVFLLYLLKKIQNDYNLEIIAAHLDHEWRKNSNVDVEFCKQITSKLNVPLFVKKASELEAEFKYEGSKEELGRKMRRFFLEQIAKEQKAQRIALAHHLQDQEENFLIRLIRGTSLSGLIGMKPIDKVYIRPLLETSKIDIIKYLSDNQISYIIDPSNESNEFLRNRIRNNVISQLRMCDNRFDQNFLRTLNKLKETEDFIVNIVKEKLQEISITNEKKEIYIDLNKLLSVDEFLQKKIVIHWLVKVNVKFQLTEKFIDEVLKFLKTTNSGNHQIHHKWYIQKKKNLVNIIQLPN